MFRWPNSLDMQTLSTGAAFGLVAGTALALAYFGGLWLTVRHVVRSQAAFVWMSLSSVLRATLALACFYLLAKAGLEVLLGALLAFSIARMLVVRHQTTLGSSEERL